MEAQDKLSRRSAVARILADRGGMLVVTGLGSPTYDCAAAGDHPLNFYLWGAMGSAVTVGLGLALAQPSRRVLVVTGDGEMLMGLGALATTGAKKPDNLAIAVLDNEHYGETGMQPTHTSAGVDLAGIARTAGFRRTATVTQTGELDEAVAMLRTAEGPVLVVLKVSSARDPLVLPSWDGAFLKLRFRQALLGGRAAA
jgi:thiamine pyrophosphate-dependent acetolactate synthase large subunit-like protein